MVENATPDCADEVRAGPAIRARGRARVARPVLSKASRDGGFQRFRANGLLQESRRTESHCLFEPVLFAAEDDALHGAAPPLQLFEQLGAAHARHVEIGDNKVIAGASEPLQGVGPVAS